MPQCPWVGGGYHRASSGLDRNKAPLTGVDDLIGRGQRQVEKVGHDSTGNVEHGLDRQGHFLPLFQGVARHVQLLLRAHDDRRISACGPTTGRAAEQHAETKMSSNRLLERGVRIQRARGGFGRASTPPMRMSVKRFNSSQQSERSGSREITKR